MEWSSPAPSDFYKENLNITFPSHILPQASFMLKSRPWVVIMWNHAKCSPGDLNILRLRPTVVFPVVIMNRLLAKNTQWAFSLPVIVYSSAWPQEEIWLHVYNSCSCWGLLMFTLATHAHAVCVRFRLCHFCAALNLQLGVRSSHVSVLGMYRLLTMTSHLSVLNVPFFVLVLL